MTQNYQAREAFRNLDMGSKSGPLLAPEAEDDGDVELRLGGGRGGACVLSSRGRS